MPGSMRKRGDQLGTAGVRRNRSRKPGNGRWVSATIKGQPASS